VASGETTVTGASASPISATGVPAGTRPGGDLGPEANTDRAGHGVGRGVEPADSAVVDRSAAVVGRTPGPFTPRQLARLDEALTLSSRETGLDFSVWVGQMDEPTREFAEHLHMGLGDKAANGVLVAVSPGQRVLHIVTGEQSSRRLPDRSCALAALSMRASFSLGDLVGGIVSGLRMLSDQAGHTRRL
jgi:uncharacterized membrane protein YgcG